MTSTLAADPHAENPLDLLKVVTWRVPAVDATLLEAVTLPASEEGDFLDALRRAAGATELVYFPTCQRVLVAMIARGGAHEARSRVHAAFQARSAAPLPVPEALGGFEAFGHLSEVASSLDSLVPGEPQVLGQMKEAFRRSEGHGLVGRESRGLTHVFPLVFRTAKAVRSNTALFRGKVSLIPLALDAIDAHLSGLAAPEVTVVGTGAMARKMAELIVETVPAARITHVSRSPDRGRSLAEYLADPHGADLVALATRTEKPLFTKAHAEAVSRANGGAPLLVVDVCLPRAVAADVASAPGTRLVALDELTALSEKAKAGRGGELDRARNVLRLELDRVAREYADVPLQRALVAMRREILEAGEARFALGAERFPEQFADPEFRKWFEQTMRHLAHVGQERLRDSRGARGK